MRRVSRQCTRTLTSVGRQSAIMLSSYWTYVYWCLFLTLDPLGPGWPPYWFTWPSYPAWDWWSNRELWTKVTHTGTDLQRGCNRPGSCGFGCRKSSGNSDGLLGSLSGWELMVRQGIIDKDNTHLWVLFAKVKVIWIVNTHIAPTGTQLVWIYWFSWKIIMGQWQWVLGV